jgi:signal transduction histidine kinase
MDLPSVFRRYGLAVVFVLLATAARLAFGYFGAQYPWLTFLVAALAAAIYGGLGPGLFALLLGGVFGDVFFAEPAGGFDFVDWQWSRILFYLTAGMVVLALAAHLNKKTREAVESRASLEREVAQRRETEERLREQQERLRRVDQRKDEFLAVLGHEMRNPLAPIQNALDLLRRVRDDEMQRTFAIGVIDRQARQLARITDDLLQFARIGTDQISLRKELVRLRDTISDAIDTVRPHFETKNQELSYRLPEGDAVVSADGARLVQVLVNLLTNASKYTPPRGVVSVSCWADADRWYVAVCDNGEGIAPDKLPMVFDMFERAAHRKDERGLGIGLALAKRIVELHGGTIIASSEGIGKGSEFRICLPAAHVPRSVEPVPRIDRSASKPALVRSDSV